MTRRSPAVAGARPAWTWLLLVTLACGQTANSRGPGVLGYDEAAWASEPDFMIGDPESGPAAFSWVPYLRLDSAGSRVLVLEPNISRMTIWTPDGDLLLDVGKRGEGPGEFVWMDSLDVPYVVGRKLVPVD